MICVYKPPNNFGDDFKPACFPNVDDIRDIFGSTKQKRGDKVTDSTKPLGWQRKRVCFLVLNLVLYVEKRYLTIK